MTPRPLPKPNARAPPCVPAASTSRADSHVSYSGLRTFDSAAAAPATCSMFSDTVEHAPSEPRLTLTPASRSARVGCTPEPSVRFDHGLCWTVAPLAATARSSRGFSHTEWMRLVRALRNLIRARYSTRGEP